MPLTRRLFARRVHLSRLTANQDRSYHELLQANQLWLQPWMPTLPEPLEVEDVRRIIVRSHHEAAVGARLDLGIFLGSEDRLVGQISLHSVQWGIIRSAGLGYWITQEEAGRGLMREALATLVSFAFEDGRLHRLWAGIQPANASSRRVVEKMGFRLEGRHRQEIFIDGRWQDQDHFALLQEEYQRLAVEWMKAGLLGP